MARNATQQLSIDALRAQISQRLRSNAAFSQQVYQEQPIIMTGRQLKSFVPDAIREARQLARRDDLLHAGVIDVFYEQARLLAGYEDDFEYSGTFSHYFPTYEDMSIEQLRGYFAWRTKARRGMVEKGSLSFAYLHLYELINLIGVPDASAGYEALLAFGQAYRHFDRGFARLFFVWLDDFVIYYGLDPKLLRTSSFAANDAAFDILAQHESHSDEALFEALVQLSSYKPVDSPFFLEHEAQLRALVAHAFRFVAHHHDAKLKAPLVVKLFGRMGLEPHRLFSRAVFADPLAITHADYQISPHDTVFCRNGAWFRQRYPSLEAPSPWVSQLLETCESILRDAYAFPNMLGRPLSTKYVIKEAERFAEELVAHERAAAARAVRIDFGKLDHIRSAADATCEKLIIEEEETSPIFAAPTSACDTGIAIVASLETPESESKEASRKDREAGCLEATIEAQAHRPHEASLEALEHELLAYLLQGGSAREFERAHACIASVLVDSINEKLYDEFADICIDTASGDPVVLEDYAEDLRALLGMN